MPLDNPTTQITQDDQERMRAMREALVDRVWVAFAWMSILALPIRWYRALELGWLPVHLIQTTWAIAIIAMAVYRRRIPLTIKVAALMLTLIAMGSIGLTAWGLASPSIIGLVIMGFLAVVLMPQRWVLTVFALSVAIIGLTAFGFVSGHLNPPMDLNQFNRIPANWLNFVFYTLGSSIVVMLAMRGYIRSVRHLVAEVRTQHDQIVAQNTLISEQKSLIEHQATHDALTGLPTRMLAYDRLTQSVSQSLRHDQKIAALFIDLDGFKLANDSFGHAAGDHVLCEVAMRLLEPIRAVDTAARLGGDEFLVVLNCINDVSDACLVANRILQSLSTPIFFEGNEIKIGASIGIALIPDHASSPEVLLKRADAAMYLVKKSGKNRYAVFSEEAAAPACR